MLNFGFTSVAMAVIASNLLIIILTLIFLNESVLYKFGLSILSVFCALIFIRMAFPFEFASFNITIKFPQIISKAIAFILHPIIPLFGHVYSISQVFALIWIVVFLIRFIDYVYSIRKTYKLAQDFGVDITDEYSTLIEQMCTKKKLQERISVVKLPVVSIPSVVGYKFHYYVLMPTDLELEDEEVELILRHELSHVIHHDLTLKFLIQTLCLFYWWNLCCPLLKKQSDLLFELRVDSSVTSEGPRKIQRYLVCLLKVKEYSVDKENKVPPSATISLFPKQSSPLHKRFCFLMENETARNKHLEKLVLLPIFVIYLASFTFIFEAYYRGPENATDGTSLNSQNMYVIENNDTTYDVYFNGIYAETVNSLDNFPKNCKIYLSLEEAQKNEEN